MLGASKFKRGVGDMNSFGWARRLKGSVAIILDPATESRGRRSGGPAFFQPEPSSSRRARAIRSCAAALALSFVALSSGSTAARAEDGAPVNPPEVAGAPASAPIEPSGEDGASWQDPYPPAPDENDPAFLGQKWHPGPLVDGKRLEYLARVPSGDTAAMPLIVVGGANDSDVPLPPQVQDRALVLLIGASSTIEQGGERNAWLAEKLEAARTHEPRDPGCSPACPAWKFVPAEAIRDVLDDFAAHVRFAHDRVQMLATIYARLVVYRALDPILQSRFAGVAQGTYVEWQHAGCPDAAKPAASPPRIFFSWGKCDATFCPTTACMNNLRDLGYEIDPASKGEATPDACACPDPPTRPHALLARKGAWDATYEWLLSNKRR